MPAAGWLPEAFLEQCPAVQWIVDQAGVLQQVYGDAAPLFGEPTGAVWSERYARVFGGEVVNLREQRGGRPWHISVFPIRVDGEVRFAGGLARDATGWSASERQLREMIFQALDAQESERRLMSRFLHDSIGQSFTALGLQIDLVRMDLGSKYDTVPARLAEIQATIERLIESTRDYMNELNPSGVDRFGLGPALERLCQRIRERFTGVVEAAIDNLPQLDQKIASALYRVADEASKNALQHSGCSRLEIALQSTGTGTFLEVRDNGRGFDSADLAGAGRGLGLLSMEHYSARAGLEFSVASSRGSGTIIRAIAPVSL